MAEISNQASEPSRDPAGAVIQPPRLARTVPAPLLLPKGYEIEEFRIEAALGVGGFGITYLAYDRKLERRVALKEYMPESLVAGRDTESQLPLFRSAGDRADFHGYLARFRAEALHIARFNHPNIVPIHRVLARNDTAYIVMEYLGGVNLQRLVASGKRLNEAEVAHLLGGVLDGLSAMHAAGLLHRDVKPSNIMLRADGTPVLIDFGSVRRAHYEGEPASVRVVSEGYSPPEQYDADGEIGPWSDLFAAAGTSYFVMRGHAPAPVVDRVLALMRRKPDPLVPLSPETTGGLYSAPFLAAIAWGLELRERARPQSVPEWAALFPSPISRRHFPGPNMAPAREPASLMPAAVELDAGDSPATLIADVPLQPVRALKPSRTANVAPAHPRESRMRLLGQLAAFGLIIVGATVGVGLATNDIGPPRQLVEHAPGAAPSASKVTPLAARSSDIAASASVQRCDDLAAHPDDPGKPAGVRGADFESMTEAATREAVEVCAAALRADPNQRRAQFNLGRALQRLARLKPQDSAETWRRAGEAYTAAAQNGYAAAQGNLGQMLYGGTGGQPLDQRRAVEWLTKSAAGNFPDAYLTLAYAYGTGRGVDQANARKSYCWMTLVERTTSVRAYRAFAQQQRAAIVLNAADKRAIEESAKQGKDCL